MTSGDDFIALAGRLVAAANPTGAALRTAISRSYYGAYHLTHQFLLSLAVAPGEEHNLHIFLCNAGNRDAEQAGKILNDLYSRRRLADYKLGRMEVEATNFARYAVEMAHRFRSHLNECSKEPARSSIETAIHAYRQQIARGKSQ